jgi:3-dehydroshikimate dehydratase
MNRLSAFADEISPDLEEQIAVLSLEHIHFVDLRGVWNTNVLDLTDQQVARIKETLDAHGIGVAAIGSPIGKVPIDSSFDEHLHHFERAITVAHAFQTPYIRIFSFYPPASKEEAGESGEVNPAEYRDEVLRRLREMTARARAAGVILLHENEKDIYGDTIARCVDLLQSCDDTHFQVVLDPANFIQCGQTPYPDAYEALRPWLGYVHVKDARADGSIVAAGEGVTHWPELLQRLRADGYDGFLSLEPHLASAGKYQGFSGPNLFRLASQALQQMLQAMGWEYA